MSVYSKCQDLTFEHQDLTEQETYVDPDASQKNLWFYS